MTDQQMTEQEVRRIAREEAVKVQKQLLKKIDKLEDSTKANTEILQRLDRLLFGEVGMDAQDTIKARAVSAWTTTKELERLNFVRRGLSVFKWFEDWDEVEKGEKESKLHKLGRLLGLFDKIEWFFALFGITSVMTFIIFMRMIIEWFNSFS